MPLEFHHLQRLEKHINELKELRYYNNLPLNGFTASNEEGHFVNPSPVTSDANSFPLHIGDFWKGRDKYLWLTTEIEIPQQWEGHDIVGIFDFGKTGAGYSSGFESLLYVNNALYSGVDTNHQEVFLPPENVGKPCRLAFRLWSGLEGGGIPSEQTHQIKRAEIACLDPSTDDLYYTGSTIVETIKILDENNYHKYELEKLLVETLRQVDFSYPRSETFFNSVQQATHYLNTQLAALNESSPVNVYCVGHTHIDVAWLWRTKHTREKLARSFSTVDRLMQKFEDYLFFQPQPQLYEYLKSDFPTLYDKIRKHVQQGKWEPAGAMWVEADCNLISGESIVRQILLAKEFFKQEFDYENNFLWLPDVFGYSWALPQILKKSNIQTFFTTKISWNEHNEIPYDTFLWRGIDGSEILTHFLTTPSLDPENPRFRSYNGTIVPATIQGTWDNYKNKDLNKDVLAAYGFGDGGGGVNREMLERKRRIQNIPTLPNLIDSNVSQYAERLQKNIKDENNQGYLHVWDDELYLEMHRGTYTSQAFIKKYNRLLELKCRNVEMLQAFASVQNNDWSLYHHATMHEVWKIVLRNQFHDIIPGSSIREVYQDSKEEYVHALNLMEELRHQSCSKIVQQKERGIAVFNSSSWSRSGLVRIPLKMMEGGHYVNENEEVLNAQVEDEEATIFVSNIPPLSFTNIFWKEAPIISRERGVFEFANDHIESNRFVIQWNNHGQLDKIYDKSLKRNVLAGLGNALEVFEDKPRSYDAWELEPTIDLKKEVITDFKGVTLISIGCHYIKVKFEWHYRNSTIIQCLVLYQNLERIDFITQVNWQERNKLLKAAFPVDVRSTKARYDIQFGSMERPTHRNTSWEHAKFEVVGHQWADLSENGLGVALLNDCKYGYDIHNNVMRLSLLKSSSYPDPEADRGMHEFTYALYVHTKPWSDSHLIQEAWDLNLPLSFFEGTVENTRSLFHIDNPCIAVDAIKKSEQGNHIVFRMHEQHGGKTTAVVQLNFQFTQWYQTDLMENKIGRESTENPVIVEMKPFEIITFLVELPPS